MAVQTMAAVPTFTWQIDTPTREGYSLRTKVADRMDLAEQYCGFQKFWLELQRCGLVDLPQGMPSFHALEQSLKRQAGFWERMQRAGFKKLLLTPKLSLREWYRLFEAFGAMHFSDFGVVDAGEFEKNEAALAHSMRGGENTFFTTEHFPSWKMSIRQSHPGHLLSDNLAASVPDTTVSAQLAVTLHYPQSRSMHLDEALTFFLTEVAGDAHVLQLRREIIALGTQNCAGSVPSFQRYPTVRMDIGEEDTVPSLVIEGVGVHTPISRNAVAQVITVF